ncbi:zinc finger protein 271 [Drosophila suzukii]|uniref:Zinc finger protein 271 n=1 Tax=Drosophila suzukii TaxID=28584 RepID=A0AB39ZBT7_DROSZ
MKLPVICRTCDSTDTDNLLRLATPSKKYPDKLLSEILCELTEINLDASGSQKLPQCLCSGCTKKLLGAYCYVKQALAANELLMKHLRNGAAPSTTDCLQEAPMELCAEQHVEVKLETEDEDCGDNDVSMTCSELPEPDEMDVESKKSVDPLTMIETVKLEAEPRSVQKPLEDDLASDFEDDDSLDNLPLDKRIQQWKTGRKSVFKCQDCHRSFKRAEFLKRHEIRVHKQDTRLFACSLCIRKFSRSEALEAHLKVHRISKRSANLSEHKKAKEVDLNLCKPHGYKLIECMICQSQYNKIADLRRHLEEHPEIVSLGGRPNVEPHEMAELFYPDSKDLGEEQLIGLIRKDLAAGIYQRFYSITNQSGYEMDLDSSETDSDLDGDPEDQQKRGKKARKASYSCELCQQKFPRKYQLYDHQRENHSWSEAPHVCGRCDGRFVSLQLLRHHNESQCRNAQKRFLCHKCPLRFRWKHNLKTHFREHRITNQTFECPECKRVFDKKKSLTVHLLSVHAEESKLIPCQWCSRKFYRHDYLVKHLKRHGLKEQDIPLAETLIAATSRPNGAKRITCRMCNLHFERIVDLRAHIQLELKLSLSLHQSYDSLHNYSITNESGFELQLEDSETEDEIQPSGVSRPVYICELCSVQCKRKFEMIQHQRTMHRFDKMPHECDDCIFKCVSKSIMDHHRQGQCSSTEKKHPCDKCSYKFMWPENLEQHVLLQHSQSSASNPTGAKRTSGAGDLDKDAAEDGVPLLQCPHCDRTYQMKSRLNNHIRDVHVNGDRKRKEAVKRFLCSLCGRETGSAAALVTHMRRHTGEKPFKCDLCEMAFPRHSELASHRRMHTGEKPFHCTVCGKDFARSDKLKRHMLTHSGLKPHKCTYCEKSYRQAKDLKLHLQQHTGECPFVCGTCGERFIQSSTLEKHRLMRRHFV